MLQKVNVTAESPADMLSALALQEVLEGKSEPLDDLLTEMAADRDKGRRLLEAEPTQRPHYSLDELLAQCDASAEVSTEDHAWLDSKPVGRELL